MVLEYKEERMLALPKTEKERFEKLLEGQAQRFGLPVDQYLRKIWYHEQAARLGEYTAMCLLEQLLSLIPSSSISEEVAV